MLRKKISKIICTLMVATTVLGANVSVANATEVQNYTVNAVASDKVIVNGEYEVDNTTEYVEAGNETGESMARKALKDKTKVKVEDGKITMTLSFSDTLYAFMKDIKVSLDGVDLQGINDTTNKTITFEVPTIDAKVQVDMNITIMGRAVSFFVTNDVESLPTVGNSEVILQDGKYQANNHTYKSGTETASKAREYVNDKTVINVEDGKVIMTMKYTEKGLGYITNTTVKVDGVDVNVIENEDKSVSFEVPAVDSKIEVGISVTVPEMNFSHVVAFDLVNDLDTIEKVSDDNSGDNSGDNNSGNDSGENGDNGNQNGGNNDNEGSTGGDTNGGTTENEGTDSGTENVATKKYTIKNTVSHDNPTGLSMARKALEETSKVELIDGKYYITLTFTEMGSTMMRDHAAYVNGNKVTSTKTVNGNIVSLKFAVGNLDDSLKVSAYVDMMGSEVTFGVNMLKDTLTLVEGFEENNNGTTTGGTTSGNTTNNSTVGNTSDTSTKEEEKIVVGKLYSIENNVIHENATGQSMARKYLNSISKVEEIEGQYYVTLTFTGAEFMQNHEIYVNGSKASITKSVNGDEINVRFAVSNLNDTIKVKVYVVPMDREVEFEVELLEDTLTFIKEYKVESLANTGGTSSAVVAGLGLLMTSAGAVLTKKRK